MSGVLTFVCSGTEATIASSAAPATEEALIAAAKNGDGQAFETLVKRLHRRILTIAVRYTRTRHDAEDVCQQTFQKAFVYLHKFEGKSSFSTGVTRIAINEALMFLRRGRGQREVSIDEHSIDAEGAALRLKIHDADPDPETSYLQREEAQILSAALEKLRPGCGERSNCGNSRSYPPMKPPAAWVSRSAPLKRGCSTAGSSYAKH